LTEVWFRADLHNPDEMRRLLKAGVIIKCRRCKGHLRFVSNGVECSNAEGPTFTNTSTQTVVNRHDRPRPQLHLSTPLIVSLLAAGPVWLNV
jgi:hypothetical protein